VDKSFEQSGIGASGFGERLRREREMRGISLDDIAAATKIGTRLLRALEEEHFDSLPGGIFNKGYVRAYAKYVGINEEQALAEYLAAASETAPDVRLIAHQNASTHGDLSSSRASGYGGRFSFVPVLILLLVTAGGIGGWHLYQQRQRERRESNKAHAVAAAPSSSVGAPTVSNSSGNAAQPVWTVPSAPTSQSATELQAPNATSSVHAAVQTVEAAENLPHPSSSDSVSGASTAGTGGSAQFEVTVRAKDHARVEIKSDGKVLVQGVMNPSDVKTIHATNKVVFWTANAGEIELSFNGKAVPLNSGENDEQVLVFNSRGLLPRPATQ